MVTRYGKFGRYFSLLAISTGFVLAAGGAIFDWGDTSVNNYKLLGWSLRFLILGFAIWFASEFVVAVGERKIEAFFANTFVLVSVTVVGLAIADGVAGHWEYLNLNSGATSA